MLRFEAPHGEREVDSPGGVNDGRQRRLERVVGVLAETEIGKAEIGGEGGELGGVVVGGEAALG